MSKSLKIYALWLLYFFGVAVLLSLLLYHGSSCFIKYLSAPTYMKTSVRDQMNLNLPAFTVCPGDPSNLTDINSISSEQESEANTTRNSSNGSNFITKDVFVKFYIRQFKANPEDHMAYYELKNIHEVLEDKAHPSLGLCYTVVIPEKYMRFGIYFLKLWFAKPISVYMHMEDQFLLAVKNKMSYKVRDFSTSQSQVTYQEIHLLEKKTESDEKSHCSSVPYDDCLYEAARRSMLAEVGCVSPWTANNGSRVCEDPSKAAIAEKIGEDLLRNSSKHCKPPCKFLIVTIDARNYMDSVIHKPFNVSNLLYLYFPSRVTLTEENFLYSFLSMVAEIGGYAGLLLGVSFRDCLGFLKKN